MQYNKKLFCGESWFTVNVAFFIKAVEVLHQTEVQNTLNNEKFYANDVPNFSRNVWENPGNAPCMYKS